MSEVELDDDGRLYLSPEVLEALRWEPGQALLAQIEGGTLLVQPASAAASARQQARGLASSLRSLTRDAGRAIRDTAAAAVSGGTDSRLQAFHGIKPRCGEGTYLATGSTLIGDVVLGEDCSVWSGVVLRGDVAPVRVGARTNIQEGAVLHVSPQLTCNVGVGVTIGHQATVHACTIGNHTLVGIHAVVLDGARVGKHCMIAAGCVVPPGMEIPDGKMVMGVPAKVVRDLTAQEIERLHWHSDAYVSLKNQYLNPSAPAEQIPAPPAAKPAPPAQGSRPRYQCRRAAGPITIDGSLDDPGWAGIPPLSALVQSDGSGAAAEQTEVRASWDDQHLYVSFACKDRDIWANYEHRDDPLYDEEVVELFLCPTGDLRHYFELELSPANVVFDARVFSPELDRKVMLVDRDWDAPNLKTAVRVSGTLNDHASQDIGWIAELAIPFSDLGLSEPPQPGVVWRVNFYRIERGAETEFTAWSPTYKSPADFHVPSSFGELVFVSGESEEAV